MNTPEGMTVQQALVQGTRRLAGAEIAGAGRDARLLMAHVLEIAPDRLTLVLPDPILAEQAHAFQAAVARRAAHEPVSHILGRRQFFGRVFEVSGDVLDPRPETEILIEVAFGVAER